MPALRIKNIAAGYVDSRGMFHPIRASQDYDPDYAGDSGARTDGRGRATGKRTGKAVRYKSSAARSRARALASEAGKKGAMMRKRYAAARKRAGGKGRKKNPERSAVDMLWDAGNAYARKGGSSPTSKFESLLAEYPSRIRNISMASAERSFMNGYRAGKKGLGGSKGSTPAAQSNPKAKSPLTQQWKAAKVRKTASGDIQVMIPLSGALKSIKAVTGRTAASARRVLKSAKKTLRMNPSRDSMGYMVSPDGRMFASLTDARRFAVVDSKRTGETNRIEGVRSEKSFGTYRHGKRV